MENETPQIPNQKFYRFNSEGHYEAMRKKLDRLMDLPKGNTQTSMPPADQAPKDENGNFLLSLPRWVFKKQEKLDKDNRPEATKRFHPVFNEEGEKTGEEEEELETPDFDEISREEFIASRKTKDEEK